MLSASLGPVSDAQQRALTVVLRNGERLSRSVGALLDFARLEAGRALLVVRPFAVQPWLEQTLAPLRPELAKAGLTLAVNVAADLPPVQGDAEKLGQVLENLVANAMKFTPAGGCISVAAERASDDASAEIEVSDTGIGIPADQLEHVFERFFQVDTSATRRVGGVGLGLSIVKSILDAHHSTIHVTSAAGHGSRFRFKLPLHESAAQGAPASAELGRGVEARILVVEDDGDVQRFVRAALQASGFTVASAFTSEEGLALAVQQRPDLVLLDLMLPDRSGLDVLQALKNGRDTADIPVVVLSATHERVRALSLGASDYLRKPIHEDALVALVRRVLAQARPMLRATILVVDDEADTVNLLREALAGEGWHVLTAGDGRQALAVLARQRPDVILLDMLIPGLSGFEVLAALGREPETARIPVIVLSARGDDASVRQGLALGARRYLSKPFDMRELLAEIRRQLASVTPAATEGRAPNARPAP
jgi:DNA-binding response OmpR family regulator/anti-sigma regulatory factor (Ser/Thr protein kinase)